MVDDDEDEEDDATIAEEPITRTRSTKKGKGREVVASSSVTATPDAQRLRALEAKAKEMSVELWDHGERLRELREWSYPGQ
jgi:hypothetical protein